MKKLIGLGALVIAVAALVRNYSDIARYLKMKQM